VKRGLTTKDLDRFRGFVDFMVLDNQIRAFERWLLYTHEGDEALQHINNTKRQRFLPFDSQKEEER